MTHCIKAYWYASEKHSYDNININGIINLGLQAVFIKFRSDILTFLDKIAQNMNMDKYMIETISLVENIPM